MRCCTLPWLILLASACACTDDAPGFEAAKPGPLRAAAVVRPLELPVGHSHAGYFQSRALGDDHPPDDPGSPFAGMFPATRGMQSAPSARVIVLDNGHTDLVLVRLDAAYTTEEITAGVLARARERLGRDLAGRLLISSTHTHGAGHRASSASTVAAALTQYPEEERHAWALGGDSFSPESLHRIVEPIVDGIEQGYATLRPARFGYGFGENRTAAGDRRCESDWLEGADQSDKRVTVLRLDDDETGAPIAMVVGYAMHGIVYDRDSRHLTVDAPGHVEYAIEAAMPEPVVAFYLQGNVGDSSPRGWTRGHGGSQAMMRAGWDLAQTALEVYRGIETESLLALSGIDRVIPLSHDGLGYTPAEFYYGGGLLCSTDRTGCEVTSAAAPDEVFCIGQAEIDGAKTRAWMSVLQIGSLYLLGVPGEPVGSYGKSLVTQALAVLPPGSEAVVAGLAMDHTGYLMEELDWLSGGYEPTISPWGWRMGPFVREHVVDLARELSTGEARLPSEARPELSFDDWSAVAPTDSLLPPGETVAPPLVRARLETVVWELAGGDPAVDQPEITVEWLDVASGQWRPVLDGAWKPVSSLTGPRLPLFYQATPSYAADPSASVRDHRWVAKWEPPRDARLAPHRLVAAGHYHLVGARKAYQITSTSFEVVANEALIVEARLTGTEGNKLAVTLRYPALGPGYSGLAGSEDWQVDGFGFVDPWFAPPFVPVLSASSSAPVRLTADGVPTELTLSVHPVADSSALPTTFLPGDGPGFVADVPPAALLDFDVAAGALQDPWGNGNAAAHLSLSAGTPP